MAKPNKAWELRIHVIIVLSLTVFDESSAQLASNLHQKTSRPCNINLFTSDYNYF